MQKAKEKVEVFGAVRVSTTTQGTDEKESPQQQKDDITNWLEKNNFPPVKHWVEDIGKSAREFSQIEYGNLGKALNKIQKSKYEKGAKLLIFANSDRFSRAEVGTALNKFTDIIFNKGIDIVFVNLDLHISSNLPESTISQQIFLVFASFQQNSIYWKNTSKRTSDAWERFRSRWIDYQLGKGQKPKSNTLMGKHRWWHVYDKENKFLSPNPETKKYVVEIFRLFTEEKLSILGIARHFNDVLKLPRFSSYSRKSNFSDDYKRKYRWTDSAIREVLISRSVIGSEQFFKNEKNENGSRVSVPILMPDGSEAIIDDFYEPIVSKETFLLAQDLLKKNKSKQGKPSKHYPFNLMQGLMICPYTGVKFNLRNEIPNKNTGRILSYFTNSNIHKMGKELKPAQAIAFEKALFTFFSKQNEKSDTAQHWHLFADENTATKRSKEIADLTDELNRKQKARDNNRLAIDEADDVEEVRFFNEKIKKLASEIDDLKLQIANKSKQKSNSELKSFKVTFNKLSKFSKNESIRKKVHNFFVSTGTKFYFFSKGIKWKKSALLNKFKSIDSRLGNGNDWQNFTQQNFNDNPLEFLNEYICLKWIYGQLTKEQMQKQTFFCEMFEELFGKQFTSPEDVNQNQILYVNNPSGEDFVGIFKLKGQNDFDAKYLVKLKSAFAFKNVGAEEIKFQPFFAQRHKHFIKNIRLVEDTKNLAKNINDLKSDQIAPMSDADIDFLKQYSQTVSEGQKLHLFTRGFISTAIQLNLEKTF